ncbi:MAG: 4Fe-4S binding protein [Desulfurococcus sp.]|nr:4Fe-4S binding protein [Desulfurococcus sp.]
MTRLFKLSQLAASTPKAGYSTRRYPFEEPLITPEFRGRVEIDPSKCIGCGACVNACPPNALQVIEDGGKLILRYFIGRCIFCWRCIDVCPVKAIKGTREFELTTDDIADLYVHIVHSRKQCDTCGSTYATVRVVKYILEKAPVAEEYADKCPECRRSLFTKALSRRVGGVE